MAIGTYISIITLNVNGLNAPIKRHRLAEWIKKNKSQIIKKIAIGTYILIINLNVNGLNAPTKRHRLAEWIQNQDPYIHCLQETK